MLIFHFPQVHGEPAEVSQPFVHALLSHPVLERFVKLRGNPRQVFAIERCLLPVHASAAHDIVYSQIFGQVTCSLLTLENHTTNAVYVRRLEKLPFSLCNNALIGKLSQYHPYLSLPPSRFRGGKFLRVAKNIVLWHDTPYNNTIVKGVIMPKPIIYQQVYNLLYQHLKGKVNKPTLKRLTILILGIIRSRSASPAAIAKALDEIGITDATAESIERRIRLEYTSLRMTLRSIIPYALTR